MAWCREINCSSCSAQISTMAHESSALPRSRANPYGYCFSAALCRIRGCQCYSIWWKSWLKECISVEVGVFGEGTLGASTKWLSAMGAEVINRWLTENEIAAILPRYHALVLSYTEASQSAVVAAAFGAGLPDCHTGRWARRTGE
jgi:hypothetical protein